MKVVNMFHNDDFIAHRRKNDGNIQKLSVHLKEVSIFTGNSCSKIGLKSYGEVIGLLHDIGRRAGVYYIRHALDGYNFLIKKGYDDAARICMTHAHSSKGEWDCTEEEMEFVKCFFEGIKFDEYDMLIQLCDALSLSHGYCLIEKRIVEGVLRLNVMNEFILVMWRGVFDAKKYFERKLGCSIYTILPGVIENTFGMSNHELIRFLSK
jgi:hypothetical protein